MLALEITGQGFQFPNTCVNCQAPAETTVSISKRGRMPGSRTKVRATVEDTPFCNKCRGSLRLYNVVTNLAALVGIIVGALINWQLILAPGIAGKEQNGLLVTLSCIFIPGIFMGIMWLIANAVLLLAARKTINARAAAVINFKVWYKNKDEWGPWLVIRDQEWAEQVHGYERSLKIL